MLGYSAYLGGNSNDQGFGVAVDALGNAYVTGATISSDFPISAGAPQPARAGVSDVFVAKLDATGTTLLYSTYLGGSGDDGGNAIAVDTAGNAYVTGTTNSNNFPVLNAFQGTTRGANEAFVAKLAPDGSALVYSTYLGSNTDDFGFGIAVDATGRAYVTGSTTSSTFPNNNAITCLGVKRTGSDAFVARLDATGSTLDYCAFLGGSGEDSGQAIAADSAGNVWVVTVIRKGAGASGVTVDFATVDGTATALNDYVATTGQVSFASGQASAVIRIPLQIELGAQPLKSFSVTLTNPRNGATLGARKTTEVRISDTR